MTKKIVLKRTFVETDTNVWECRTWYGTLFLKENADDKTASLESVNGWIDVKVHLPKTASDEEAILSLQSYLRRASELEEW